MCIAFNQFARLINPFRVMLASWSHLANTAAVMQMVFEADTDLVFLDGIAGKWYIARTDRVYFMDQLQYCIYRITERVRTIIFACFLINRTCFEDARVRFFGNADRWIALSVFEEDVIMRLILFDQVVL